MFKLILELIIALIIYGALTGIVYLLNLQVHQVYIIAGTLIIMTIMERRFKILQNLI